MALSGLEEVTVVDEFEAEAMHDALVSCALLRNKDESRDQVLQDLREKGMSSTSTSLEDVLTHRVAEKLKPVVVQPAGSSGRGRECGPDMLVRELPAERFRVELVDQATLLKIRHEGREHESSAKDGRRQEVQQTSLWQAESRQLR